jgi:DNA polymerase-3 subunit gamma/tau
MAVFYRTYRPQKFSEVVGQEPIVSTLKNAVKNNKVAHAYLFCGSRGIGKTTIARLLAKAVNCLNVKDGEPCGKCSVCEAIKNNLFIDLVEIDAASHTGVDNVRELIEHIKFKPTSARYKVFIIDEVHMLSKAAFNALLKTLEEPPEHAIFILATTDVHKVPATIISRTQRFDFARLTAAELVEQMQSIAKEEKLKIEDAVFHLIARQSQGSSRDALSLLNKVSSSGSKITLRDAELQLGSTGISHSQNLVDLLLAGNAGAIPKYFEDLEQDGIDFSVFNRNFLEYLRSLLVIKVTGIPPAEYLPEETAVMENQVAQLQPVQIIYWLRLFLRSYKDLAVVPEPSLALLLAGMEAVIKQDSGSLRAPVAPQVSAPAAKSKIVKNESIDEPKAAAQETIEKTETIVEAPLDPYTLEEVQLFWPQVLERLKLVNGPLAMLVKNSPLTKVSGADIFLSVKYLFHKEHLESRKIHSLLLSTITELGGKPARLKIEINSGGELQPPTGVDAISEVLRVFGGELVE